MNKHILYSLAILLLIGTAVSAQEVMVGGFPLGVGSNVDPEFFSPYASQLQAVADSLAQYPLVIAVVTGGADGEHYRQNNDAQNPGLALGRAHALRNVLITTYGVDARQLVVQSTNAMTKGKAYRFASVRIVWDLAGLKARLDTLANRPPVEMQTTVIREVPVTVTQEFTEDLGAQLSAGISSSPFGGIPVVAGAVTWKKIFFIEGMLGHTFWNRTFPFEGVDLDTRRRISSVHLIVYPFDNVPVGIVGGWAHVEEIAQEYYEYVKMSEGPLVGLRVAPIDYLYITATYNPSHHRIAGSRFSRTDNDQFLLSVTAHKIFGGGN